MSQFCILDIKSLTVLDDNCVLIGVLMLPAESLYPILIVLMMKELG